MTVKTILKQPWTTPTPAGSGPMFLGRSRSKLMRNWQSGEFPPAIKPRVNAYTDGNNSEDANVKRFAPTMYFPADGTFALLSGAERPTLGAVSVISASAAR
jgi:hypothetical protein